MRVKDQLVKWRYALPAFIVVAILAAFLNPADPGLSAPDLEFVQRVVDGDTLILGTGERVRLIGCRYPGSGELRGGGKGKFKIPDPRYIALNFQCSRKEGP